MLFFTDEQPIGEDFDKINFKKKDWYQKFHWTSKQEDDFIVWLSKYLKKNWEGIAEHKLSNKKLRDMAASNFVFNYGPVTRELRSDDFTAIVSWAHLDEVMSKGEREAFNKWMFGQTTALHGVYRGDLTRWLSHLSCTD